ncbi:hypothetical protein [Ekhidna sp.]|uniref:hypothetical protein n=1 Tax=Ekhidna sp. TaxID=2608089 RepID=UPI003B50C13F
MLYKIIYFFLIFSLLSVKSYSQPTIDDCYNYYYENEIDSAFHCVDFVIPDLIEQNDSRVISLYNLKGVLFEETNDLRKAREAYLGGISLIESSSFEVEKEFGDIYRSLAWLSYSQGNTISALENYLEAFSIYIETQDVTGKYSTQMDVAQLYRNQFLFDDAMELIECAENDMDIVFSDPNDAYKQSQLGNHFLNEGIIYFHKFDKSFNEKTEEAFIKAIQAFKRAKDEVSLLESRMVYQILKYESEKTTQPIITNDLTVSYEDVIQQDNLRYMHFLLKGDSVSSPAVNLAVSYYDSAFKIAQQLKSSEFMIRSIERLINLNHQYGDTLLSGDHLARITRIERGIRNGMIEKRDEINSKRAELEALFNCKEDESCSGSKLNIFNICMPIYDVIAITFGILTLIAMIIIALININLNPFSQWLLRVVISIAAAGVAVTISGLISVEISGIVKAGGAIAVFVLVYLTNPPKLLNQ